MSLGFEVGDAVEGVLEQAFRALVQRKRHGVDGEVAAAKVFRDSGRGNDWRLSCFEVLLAARHAEFGAHVAREVEVERVGVVIGAMDDGAGLLKLFL